MKPFKKVYVEITNLCNLACSFCPGTSRPQTFMAPDTFALLLTKLQGKTRTLYFHLMGEPLLHPQLDLLLDMAHDAGFTVNLTTNGTRIHLVGELLLTKPALRQINFSLHSRTESEDFEGYVERVLAFARRARGGPLYVSLRLWNLDAERSNPDNDWILAHLAAEFGLPPESFTDWDGLSGIPLAPRLYLNQASVFAWPDIHRSEEISQTGYCLGLRDHLGILSDGTVVPCCLDAEGQIPLGNLLTAPLDAILDSPRAQAMAEGFSQRVLAEELCRKCGYRSRFD